MTYWSANASASSTTHDFSAVDTWIVDTWATHHMSANVNALSNVNPYNGDEKIIIGNGQGLDVNILVSRNSLLQMITYI